MGGRRRRLSWTRRSRPLRPAGRYRSWVTSRSAPRSSGYVRECPFPDMRPIENPPPVEVRAAPRGGFSARVPRRKPTTPAGQVSTAPPVGVADAVGDAATPGVPTADDACSGEVASARAALPPRSPWTEAVAQIRAPASSLSIRTTEARRRRARFLAGTLQTQAHGCQGPGARADSLQRSCPGGVRPHQDRTVRRWRFLQRATFARQPRRGPGVRRRMIVYAVAAGSFKRNSGAPDAAEHCAPAKRGPELMTGNMLGRFRIARHDGRSGLGLENTGGRVSRSVSCSRTAPETRRSSSRAALRMARPGLEPGTPRFSDVDRNVSNSRVIPAIERVSVIESHWLDVRRLRSFLADSGTEMRIGTQCETAGARRCARGSWTTSACPSCRAWPLASPAPFSGARSPASSWSFRLRGRGAGRRGRGRSAPWRVAGCRSWSRGSLARRFEPRRRLSGGGAPRCRPR
jgi:hypothetical protein